MIDSHWLLDSSTISVQLYALQLVLLSSPDLTDVADGGGGGGGGGGG